MTQEATGRRMHKEPRPQNAEESRARKPRAQRIFLPPSFLAPDTQTAVSRSQSKPAASQETTTGEPCRPQQVKGTRSPGAAANRRRRCPAPQPIRARPPLRCSLGALPSLHPPTEPKLRSYPRPQPLMSPGAVEGHTS